MKGPLSTGSRGRCRRIMPPARRGDLPGVAGAALAAFIFIFIKGPSEAGAGGAGGGGQQQQRRPCARGTRNTVGGDRAPGFGGRIAGAPHLRTAPHRWGAQRRTPRSRRRGGWGGGEQGGGSWVSQRWGRRPGSALLLPVLEAEPPEPPRPRVSPAGSGTQSGLGLKREGQFRY